MVRRLSFVFSLIVLSTSLQLSGQAAMVRGGVAPPFQIDTHLDWVDSTFNAMSTDQRIGQLFMVAAYSNKDEAHAKVIETLVTEQHVGGLIFMKGSPHAQAVLTNRLQKKAKVPLMMAMDAEWGLAMRLDSTISYPRQMMLGAIQNDSIIYQMGVEIAKQSKRLGVHIDFAPVVDVNNNPKNPVIGNRSFGENKWRVAQKGVAYMQGLQSQHVLANAKHFPGHGDTDVDSHKDLPIIDFDRVRLDSLELFPFRQLIARGLGSMMVAHLYIPQLDSTPNLATTLSPIVVNDLLKEDMGFKGLTFTDALNMKGVARYWEPGEVEVKALLAGNDVLLFPEDVPDAISRIKQAVADSLISMREIEKRCHKILMAKAWMGLNSPQQVDLMNLTADLNNEDGQRVNRLLHERAITLLNNQEGVVPRAVMEEPDFAYVSIKGYLNNGFHKELKKYGEFQAVAVPDAPTNDRISKVVKSLAEKETIIISLRGMKNSPKGNFGLDSQSIALIKALDKDHKVVLVVFGNPYALDAIDGLEDIEATLITYQQTDLADQVAAEVIMGRLDATGRLPVSIGQKYAEGTGSDLRLGVLTNAMPEEFGISSADLRRIDGIALNGIEEGAFPGCAILIAKEGKVIYDKAFGTHTYELKRPVRTTDVYDLASITKIAATAISLIKLQEQGVLSVDDTIGQHLEEISDTSEYRDLKIRDILAHRARLIPWIPFYKRTLAGGKLDPDLYRKSREYPYTVHVAEDVWMHENQKDTLLTRILSTELSSKEGYKYSDLGYYLIKEIIERKTGMALNEYAAANFYGPMGLRTMTYRPLEKMDRDRIVPTEYDAYYRMQLLQGHVHDMGAAMQGGVGGHAGLFSDTRDMAAMMQMLLDGGIYRGQRLLDEGVIQEYTDCQYCDDPETPSKRAIAFDKPNEHDSPGPTCDCVSGMSFGHTGFTGTIAWADPEEDIVYVFLSNRVYPSMTNGKINELNIRTRIMETIYDSLHRVEQRRSEGSDLDVGFQPLMMGFGSGVETKEK